MSPRRLGQHFLVDQSVAGKIIRAARIGPEDTVVEVGPGRGALTGQLAASAGRLAVVEIDPALAAEQSAKYAGRDDVAVLNADARVVSVEDIPFVADADEYILVANLPYYAATPIIRNFLESARPPRTMVVMVQREVAREMQAEPGKMSMLSVATQVYAAVETLLAVPPSAFRPPPRVNSSVIRLNPLPQPAVQVDSLQSFFDLVRNGFKAPRKQMHNSLAKGLNIPPADARALVESAGVETERRPATLSLAEWQRLYEVWSAAGRPFVVHGSPRNRSRARE